MISGGVLQEITQNLLRPFHSQIPLWKDIEEGFEIQTSSNFLKAARTGAWSLKIELFHPCSFDCLALGTASERSNNLMVANAFILSAGLAFYDQF